MEWNKIQVLVGTVDYTSYLADKEQTASLPDGPEIGRASFVLLDDGTMPAINDWSSITLKGGGTAATVNLWSGYVTRQQSEPFSEVAGAKRLLTLDCQSAAIKLLTSAPVTQIYGGGDKEAITYDRDIVVDLINTYAPSIYDVSKIGTANQVEIDYIGFKNESLRSALNKVAERAGRKFGVDSVPEFWYGDEDTDFPRYGYRLSDVEATWSTAGYLPMSIKPVYDRDATELRNSVRILGGSTLSVVQVETFAGDDVTTVFQVNYTPDVVISVEVGGIAQTVGIMYVDDPADFDCLVEYDRRQFHFDTAPASGKNLVIQYRYSTRVDVTVIDATSIAAVGTIWAPVLEDASISSAAQGSALGSAYLANTQATTRATLSTRHGGTADTVIPWQPGNSVLVNTEAFGWADEQLLIRGVTMRAQPMPGGDGSCVIIWDLDVGSGPASAGRVYGRQWNNTEVLPQNVAPDGIERLGVEASAGVTDHGALTGLTDDDHTGYLLATGARTGASSQAQTFTNGVIGPTWKPASDSTTALQLQQAGGAAVVTVDTSNSRVGIGATPTYKLHVAGDINTTTLYRLGGDIYLQPTGGVDSLSIGKSAGGASSTGAYNLFVGYGAGQNNTSGQLNCYFGTYSGQNGTTGGGNCAVGYGAGYSVAGGTYNVFFGPYSGFYNAGSNNLFIGNQTGWSNLTGSGNVFIGYQAGYNETGSDKLYIANSNTSTPLIYGDFSASTLKINTADAATSTVTNTLTLAHNTSGTAAAGYGSGLLFTLESSTTADQNAAQLAVTWTDATHATRTSKAALFLVNSAAALAEVISFAPAEVVVNDGGNATTDFRAETDTEANMVLVDASADLLYLGGTTNGIKIAKGGDLTLIGTATYERHVQIPVTHVGAAANQPTPVDVFTAGGDQYPTTGAKYGFLQWEVPDDWDGGDVYMEIDWLPDSGAISGTSAVRWTVEYRAIAEGEAINNGSSVTLDNGAGGDTADYSQYQTKHTRFTLAYNNANQPLTKQDHVYFKVSRDTSVANDFSGSVVVTAYEIIYNSTGFPTSN